MSGKAYGPNNGQFKHGLTMKHPLYTTWQRMKRRCYYKGDNRYYTYGERGITVCKQWRDNFLHFYNWALNNGWEEGLQIDRKDNNKNYAPENCRFVTPKQNSNNRNRQRNNSSGYVGVTYATTLKNLTNPWSAYVYINRRRKHIGYFKTPLLAAKARDEYVVDNDLSLRLNFGKGGY